MYFEPAGAQTLLSPLPDRWELRPRRPRDIPGVIALMERVYVGPHGPEAVWPAGTLMQHFDHFPEGQFCIVDGNGRVVADSTTMLVRSCQALRPHRWSGITDRGTLSTHDPSGDAIYGVDLAVDPEFQGMGLAHHLYVARLGLGQRLGCRCFIAGARMPGYHLASDHLSPEGYLSLVKKELIFDPTLSKQLRLGFQIKGEVLRNYIKDPESENCAALIYRDL